MSVKSGGSSQILLRIKKKVFFAQKSRVIPVIPLIFVSHEGITGITY